MISLQDAMNDALERLYNVGFTHKLKPMLPSFAEHGPMVSEALVALGASAAIPAWIERYKLGRHHEPIPGQQDEIVLKQETSWRSALGNVHRITDWLFAFRLALHTEPWSDVIRNWVPILMAGYSGGLTHGLIRTTYIVRSFPSNEQPSSLQLDELSRGLAYWAATYQTVPGNPLKQGQQSLEEALTLVPRSGGFMRAETVASDLFRSKMSKHGIEMAIEDRSEFVRGVESLRSSGSIEEAISHHTALFARVVFSHSERAPIPLIHTVTAPAAMRTLLPHLPEDFHPVAYRYLWQVSAALVSRFAGTSPFLGERGDASADIINDRELVDLAIENGDEHVIKFTEACLRENGIRTDPIYRMAAISVVRNLGPFPKVS